jgi:hypothetical protein
MAVTYTGCVASPKITGTGLGNINAFVVENGRGSATKVCVRRLVAFMDPIEGVLTAVKPIITAYRGTFSFADQEGVILLDKGYFDSAQTSDGYVKLWAACTPDSLTGIGGLTVTTTDRVWREFSPSRLYTSAGIELGNQADVMPQLLSDPTYDFNLLPGEALAIVIEPAAVTSDPTTNNWMFNCVWTEETLTTYTISGFVTLSGVGVVGAKINIVVADDHTMTNAYFWGTATSIAAGAWSAAIPAGKYAYAYAQNDVTGTLYTAPGAPYLI